MGPWTLKKVLVHSFVSHAWKIQRLSYFVIKVSSHKNNCEGFNCQEHSYFYQYKRYIFMKEPWTGLSIFCSRPRPLHEIPPYLCPDRNKVNFIPKSGSAFCLVSILKPLLPTQELNFRSGVGYRSISPSLMPLGGVAVRSLSPSMGPVLSRGRQSPCLPRHLEEPEG